MSVAEAVTVRKLRFRLKRQGMAELDLWLSLLEPALECGDEAVRASVEMLLDCEPPMLLAMMHGEEDVPQPLRPWLEKKG